jgi:hypothetical protein
MTDVIERVARAACDASLRADYATLGDTPPQFVLDEEWNAASWAWIKYTKLALAALRPGDRIPGTELVVMDEATIEAVRKNGYDAGYNQFYDQLADDQN